MNLAQIKKDEQRCENCKFCILVNIGETKRYDCDGKDFYYKNVTSPGWGRDCPYFNFKPEVEAELDMVFGGKPYMMETHEIRGFGWCVNNGKETVAYLKYEKDAKKFLEYLEK